MKITRVLLTVTTATLFALAFTAIAGAHAHLARTEPVDGETISKAPEHLQLVFGSKVDVAVSLMDLMGPTGKVSLGEVHEMEANTLMAVVKGDMADGGYTVLWQTAAADGHPEKGSFAFILKRTTH